MRLIDADKLGPYSTKGTTYEGEAFFAYEQGMQLVIEDIEAAPTIEFRDYGKWKRSISRQIIASHAPVVQCSNCGLYFCDIINVHDEIYRYCPYCGAKMWRTTDEKSKGNRKRKNVLARRN